jgi:hypothetical protein
LTEPGGTAGTAFAISVCGLVSDEFGEASAGFGLMFSWFKTAWYGDWFDELWLTATWLDTAGLATGFDTV